MNSLKDLQVQLAASAGVLLAVAGFAAAGHAASPLADDHDWRQAIETRSDALNRQHGLGEQEWMRALQVRSEALNRLYGLG